MAMTCIFPARPGFSISREAKCTLYNCHNAHTAVLSKNSCRRQFPGSASRFGRPNRQRGRVWPVAAADPPYEFQESDYYKAAVSLVITAGDALESNASQGTVLLSREDEDRDAASKALLLFVGGDTLHALAQLVQGQHSNRPLTLDLLWKILERGQEITEAGGGRSKWRLVRVAIVDMQHSVYLGRLFFGDAATGEIVWDCDCRPSDGFWLAIKSKCPIFVKREVWDAYSTIVEAEGGGTLVEALQNSRAIRFGASGKLRGDPAEDLTGTALYTTVRSSDPEPIKRLKMEMNVALNEEDYAAAARIRDHPYLQLYMASLEARKMNHLQEADRLDQELAQAIEENESKSDRRQSDAN